MSKILNTQNISEYNKWQLYSQALQKYLHFIGDAKIMKLETKNQEIDKKENLLDDFSSNYTHIIESVPIKYRAKAKQLLVRLHRAGEERVSWDDQDRVFIDGNPVENSNIVDLINDAMRARKTHTVCGRSDFAKLLREIGVPNEFVGNNELWKEVEVKSSSRKKINRQNRVTKKALEFIRHRFPKKGSFRQVLIY